MDGRSAAEPQPPPRNEGRERKAIPSPHPMGREFPGDELRAWNP